MSKIITKIKIYALILRQTSLQDIANNIYCLRVFYKYSFKNNSFKRKESEITFLTKQYNIVEKVLALQNQKRLCFGKEKINLLLDKSKKYQEKFGKDKQCLYHSKTSLKTEACFL